MRRLLSPTLTETDHIGRDVPVLFPICRTEGEIDKLRVISAQRGWTPAPRTVDATNRNYQCARGCQSRKVGLMLRFGAILSVCGLGLAFAVPQAQAFEIFGFKFFEPEEDQSVELIDPLPYSVAIQVNGGGEVLQNVIERSSVLFRNQDRAAPGRAGLLSRANGDYGRLVDALYSLGYFGGEVSIRINGAEVSELPLDVNLPTPSPVQIVINPGEIYTFGVAEVTNIFPGTDLSEFGFETGAPALSGAVRDAGRTAVVEWQEAGYAKADIPQTDIVADHNRQMLNARLAVVSGPKVTYGPLTIEGTNRVRHDYLAYMADLPKGETYSPKQIAEARKRLLKLDAFGVVEIEESEELGPDNSMPLNLNVQDRPPRRFGVGATISTLDGGGVEGFWLHRNILSRAERLRFDVSVDGIGRSLDPTDYDYSLGTTFIKPGALTPDTDFKLAVELSQEKLDNYTSLAFGLTAGFSSIINERLTGELGLSFERSRIDDQLGRRQFTLYGIDGGLTYERRDVPLDATKGYFLDLSAFPFYDSKSGNTGVRSAAEARVYTTLGQSEKFVLAGRAKIGAVAGVSLTQAPPQLLFFSGGGGSVRGFQYQSNGVTLPGGQEVGGRSLIELSGEIRTKINDSFGVVGFIDGGLVGPDPTPDFNQPFKVGVGVGLRWRTGLGPLRVDVARAVNRTGSDPIVGVYIGLGQAF